MERLRLDPFFSRAGMVRTARLACVHVGDANAGRRIRMQFLRLLGEYLHRYSSSTSLLASILGKGARRVAETHVLNRPSAATHNFRMAWRKAPGT